MQREYTRERYLERIAWIKERKRDISLTTDIIVGFPGETDRDFEETVTLLEKVRYDARLRLQVLAAAEHAGHPHARRHLRRGQGAAALHSQ